jgi:hypothetical protein
MLRRLSISIAAFALLALPAAADARQKHGSSKGRTKAAKLDRNRDGLPDRWERRHGLSLKVNQAGRDQDRDGATNAAEFAAKTDPRDRDSDDDGLRDGAEDAGVVTSFDGTTLVVTLAGGSTVTGLVTSGTEIKGCAATAPAPAPATVRSDDGHEDDGPTAATASEDNGADDNGADDSSDDHGDDAEQEDDAACDASVLTPGTAIHEAQLVVRAAGPTFREIELA